ncbi:glycoside hydrolase family 88 protein [Flavobacterium sp. MAHUQ-51]|uniref:glycoside hydrolase family 88 protein n=1 Tax=Flavobacterium sp. GCM10022190 TaxID=3252639 RepID=UPI0036121C20
MSFSTIALSVLLIAILVVFLMDWIPQFNTWQSRIHIGRYTSKEIWKDKLVKKSVQWLHKTPTITVTDNNRLIIIDILKGNYKRTAIQSWQKASLLLGLNDYAIQTKDTVIKKQINDFVQNAFDATGNWKRNPTEVDDIILGYAILKIENLDFFKYKPAFDYCYQLILSLKGTDGIIAYRKHNSDYRYVDTIGFISPFLVRYGILLNVNDAVELGISQIREFNKYGMLEKHDIPCHTYNIKTKLSVGLFGWGRGLGWYAIGLIDAWLELPAAHPNKLEITEMVKSFAAMAVSFQNENGSWNWLITNAGSRLDSSTTATLAWFFANAAAIPEIQSIAEKAKDKALNYLMQVTRRDGAVDFSQGDTKSIGVHSQHFDILPFTQGLTLRTSLI